MSRKFRIRAMGVLLSGLMLFQGNMPVNAVSIGDAGTTEDISEDTVQKARVVLTSLEEATTALNTLLGQKEISALVYLCDTYNVRNNADSSGEFVTSLSSGETVQIIGIGEDSGRNIWFKIRYSNEIENIEGYIERDFLAYSDEEMLNWEKQYVKSYSRSALGSYTEADIQQFPSSYQAALTALKKAHPSWKFVKMDTGLDWNTVVGAQTQGDRSLIWTKTSIQEWISKPFDGNWSVASPGIVKYYLDPRNFLTEDGIFQFEQLTYNGSYHNLGGVSAILSNSFMNSTIPGTSTSYAQAFMDIGAANGLSPYMLASRVKQEQGTAGTSALISGTYPGYEGYYNYFNIGASGNTTVAVITSGLNKAKEKGWNSRYTSLSGGAAFIGNGYIKRGQDTLYLQKFDVDSRYDGVNWHQYMQNIQAPTQESQTTKKAYASAGALNSAYVFRIPVYNNMPGSACAKPSATQTITLNTGAVNNLPVNQSVTIIAYINGVMAGQGVMTFTSNNEGVAKVDANGVVTAIAEGTAVISCTKENATTATCTVQVVKSDITEYTIPTLEPITYDGNQKLGNIVLPANWTWNNPDLVPTADNKGYPATYTPDPSKYNPVTVNIPITVNKATVAAPTAPTGLTGAAGYPLSSVQLPVGFAWEKPEQVIQDTLGTAVYTASYNPDEINYNTLSGISITIKVVCQTHDFTDWKVTDATCSTKGQRERNCKVTSCGYVEKEEIPVLPHDYTSWQITTAATCTVTGIRSYECKICKEKVEEEIPATGHNLVTTVTTQPDHKNDGVQTTTCSNTGCTYSATEVLPKQAHTYQSSITKQASCTEKGIKTYKCSGCDASYTEEIAMVGHTYVAVITTPATEAATGVKTFTCSVCKSSYTESIPKLGHTYKETITKNPTCTETGSKTLTCACGDTKQESIPVLGHAMKDGKCTRCSYVDSSYKNESNSNNNSTTQQPAHTHSYGATITTEATCTTAGVRTYTCSCGSSYTESIGAAGHNLVSGTCSRCGYKDPAYKNTTGSTNNNTNTGGTNKPEGNNNETKPSESDKNQQETPVVETIVMEEDTQLTSAVLKKIQGKNESVELKMGEDVSWIISGKNVEGGLENPVDMKVVVGSSKIPQDKLSELAVEGSYMELALAHDGAFGFDAELSLKADKTHAGQIGNLFYFNPETKEFEFVGESLVEEDGSMKYLMSHASDYIIIFAAESMKDMQVNAPSVPEVLPEDMGALAGENDVEKEETASFDLQGILIPVLILLAVIGGCIAIIFAFRKPREDEFDRFNRQEDNPEEIVNLDEDYSQDYASRPYDDYEEEYEEETEEYFDEDEESLEYEETDK